MIHIAATLIEIFCIRIDLIRINEQHLYTHITSFACVEVDYTYLIEYCVSMYE